MRARLLPLVPFVSFIHRPLCRSSPVGGGSLSSSAAAWTDAELVRRCRGERIVIGSRARRVVFGGTLVVGALALLGRAALHDLVNAPRVPHAWHVVVFTWLLALVAAVCAAPLARCLLSQRCPGIDDDDRLFVASLTLPAAGLALLLPITLHMPIALLLGGSAAFDRWCTWSVAIVGHAHIVLAVLAAHRAAGLCDEEPERGSGRVVRSAAASYLITILVSVVPFGLRAVIPPLLIAVTGLPLLGCTSLLVRIIERERNLLSLPTPSRGSPVTPVRAFA